MILTTVGKEILLDILGVNDPFLRVILENIGVGLIPGQVLRSGKSIMHRERRDNACG